MSGERPSANIRTLDIFKIAECAPSPFPSPLRGEGGVRGNPKLDGDGGAHGAEDTNPDRQTGFGRT